ncbi:MAG: hypothetical protein HC888_06695 [Candidatus Competibacteraceae bacterium]|nr:hypothetical protein [Candidatus Competibacteraceae bacterium]
MKIEYRKAKSYEDLTVYETENQIMVKNSKCQSGAVFCVKPGPFYEMSESEALEAFNGFIEEILEDIRTSRPREVEPGEPQIKWNKECYQYTPIGDVLRCEVSWDRSAESEEGNGAVAIRIDDKLLSGQEFLDLLAVHEGSGMRIEFMHVNRLSNPPEPILISKA